MSTIVAFTSGGKKGTAGECWHPNTSADRHYEIIIKADRDDPVDVLAILVRELVHALLPLDVKHGKSALKYAVQFQLIVRNPADAVKPPKAAKATLTTLTIEQSAILLNAIHDKPIYWPVLLALTTGMRRGEILAMRWKNVDFEQKTVRIVESLEQTKKGLRFKAPKTERTRAVILPDYAVEELKGWKEKQAEELSELKIQQNEDTLVCCRFDGEPIWPTSVTHEFTKAMKRLPDLPKVRFHDLRHSHATQLLSAGIHPKIAQERLGHSTITTTLDLYSHVTTTMQDDAASRLDSALRSAIKAKHKTPQLG